MRLILYFTTLIVILNYANCGLLEFKLTPRIKSGDKFWVNCTYDLVGNERLIYLNIYKDNVTLSSYTANCKQITFIQF